jgi:hypothetical protein
LAFWVLAPFDWLFGATGVLVGTGGLNAIAVGGAVLVGYRRGGMRLALLVALVEALLAHAIGLSVLVDPWNPWIAFLPFVLFVLLVWCVLCDDFVMLPVAVGVGSFSLQAHASYLPLVGGLLVIALGWAMWGVFRARRASVPPASVHAPPAGAADTLPASQWSALRAVGVSAVVAVVVWSAPLVQQLTGNPGNLGNLISYARHPSEPPVGLASAFGVMGAQVRFPGPWVTGNDADRFGYFARSGSTIPALVLVAVLMVCIAWARRRGAYEGGRLAVIALVVLGLSVVATARTTSGSLFPYVIRWWWAVPAVAALAIVWTAMTTCPAAFRKPVAVAVFVALVATVAIDLAELPASVPNADISKALAEVAGPTANKIQRARRYLVAGAEQRGFGASTAGLYVELHRRGFDVFAKPEKDGEIRYGSWRLARPEEVDAIITIVNVAELDHTWEPADGSRRIAFWDPLSSAQRARARELEGRIRVSMGELAPAGRVLVDTRDLGEIAIADGARPDDVDELHDLQKRGDGYAVYMSPA